jgi:excisionase family DNA binding protein
MAAFGSDPQHGFSTLNSRSNPAGVDDALEELLTVDDVAALLRVSRSWVYEHTRTRVPRIDRLPFVKIGKYVRFQSRAVKDFLAKRSRIA